MMDCPPKDSFCLDNFIPVTNFLSKETALWSEVNMIVLHGE